MTKEFSTDDLTDKELLKKCIMSLSDTILYTNALIDRQYKLEVKRDEMRRICYVYKNLWNTLNTTDFEKNLIKKALD